MTAFRLTAEGDFDVSTGRLVLTDGIEEKAQKIDNSLSLCQGEWFLDQREGVPYFKHILGVKNPNLEIIKRIYTRVIQRIEGIADVEEMVVTLDTPTRVLSYSWKAIDDEGQPITGGLGAPFIVEES